LFNNFLRADERLLIDDSEEIIYVPFRDDAWPPSAGLALGTLLVLVLLNDAVNRMSQ
jgi:hypothetical protein